MRWTHTYHKCFESTDFAVVFTTLLYQITQRKARDFWCFPLLFLFCWPKCWPKRSAKSAAAQHFFVLYQHNVLTCYVLRCVLLVMSKSHQAVFGFPALCYRQSLFAFYYPEIWFPHFGVLYVQLFPHQRKSHAANHSLLAAAPPFESVEWLKQVFLLLFFPLFVPFLLCVRLICRRVRLAYFCRTDCRYKTIAFRNNWLGTIPFLVPPAYYGGVGIGIDIRRWSVFALYLPTYFHESKMTAAFGKSVCRHILQNPNSL